MREMIFPPDFLWGAATAAHQVEGDNTNSDWWEWERLPGTPCREPSGSACDHYHRYPDDVRLLASLGLNTYRFSVEWARIEPSEGVFDLSELDHYRRMVETVRAAGLIPMVTLNHTTLPRWNARQGGWMATNTPNLFERYCRRVVEELGDRVEWYCTINEPGLVAIGGYLGAQGFPPGTRDVASWQRAIAGLIEGHRRALGAVKELRPDARVGATHSMQEWESNPGGRPVMEYVRRMTEDIFLQASAADDFIGVQTYTRVHVNLPAFAGPLLRLALASPFLVRAATPWLVSREMRNPNAGVGGGARRTQMGYEYRPEATVATIRRVADLYPGKDIVVTEHGVATAHDAERIEFIARGLAAIHGLIGEGLPIRGYIHWSALDNFEWTRGYGTSFGLVAVDRPTQQRTVKPSARFLGAVARTGRLVETGGSERSGAGWRRERRAPDISDAGAEDRLVEAPGTHT